MARTTLERPKLEPGFYQDEDGDYWLKTTEGIWLYADMLWGDQWTVATSDKIHVNPEETHLERINPAELDCLISDKERDAQ
ncbi:hypothetical protein [Bifidobacterium eulemuris]|uniref:Uncharacterized protein n=1 Tax=Bifidobacterium eulemuris TaxID=1765219 RepID=A0A261G9X3_9BIFI|nr:hypothetical protein [Bifidobacterium eulemuris]OZG68219.1 hypothetical protein BEUL_1232 [Bifidobacterium eulemuris]QOL31724.1 hypothetical protein BE0216_04030 [Bifidobacterium eulemuris]